MSRNAIAAGRLLLRQAQERRDTLVDLRRRVHARPELGFQEHETARLAAQVLQSVGAQVRTGVGGTGVIGEIGFGRPIVAIRADLDALPLHEATGLPFASSISGVMHACGHDAHVACGLGAALLLAAAPPFQGTVRILMQPSEEQKDTEGWSGAMRLLAEGALDDVEAVIALHTRALPVGCIGLTDGPALAANDTIRIIVEGRAAHAAHPEEAIDAIAIAARIVNTVPEIVARHVPPGSGAVVSVTTFHGGTKENVIAHRVELGGTVRSGSDHVRMVVLGELERLLDVGRALGAHCSLEIQPGYPVLINDPSVTAIVRDTARHIVGVDRVMEMPFDTWAEDFAYMTARVPGSMFWLGVTSPRVPRPVWHNPSFDLDEDALPVGAAVLAASALQLLEAAHGPPAGVVAEVP